MNDWNEIYNYNDLKYDTYKIIETFWLLILMGSKKIKLMIAIRTWPNAKHGLEKLLTSI
jgi:hypothetical protein